MNIITVYDFILKRMNKIINKHKASMIKAIILRTNYFNTAENTTSNVQLGLMTLITLFFSLCNEFYRKRTRE